MQLAQWKNPTRVISFRSNLSNFAVVKRMKYFCKTVIIPLISVLYY